MATPSQIENARLQRISLNNASKQLAQVQTLPSNLIENAIPSNLKLKGQAAIGKRVLDLGQKAISLVLPKLKSLAQEFAIDQFNQLKDQATNPEAIAQLKAQYCPSPQRLQQLIETRNNIVGILTRLNGQFNNINQTITGLNQTTIGLTTIFKIASFAETAIILSAATGLLPAPALGPALSRLDQAQKQIRNFQPKIEKAQTTLSAINIPLTITTNVFTQIINLLQQLDQLILFCGPSTTQSLLSEIPNLSIETTTPDNTYQGFTFQIETIAFSPTVNQLRALALNQFGIPVLESELSFTTNPQTLIDELKLIIDRDNLKAY